MNKKVYKLRSAGVPISQMSATVQAATAIASGQAPVAGVVRATAAVLKKGLVNAMVVSKRMIATAIVLSGLTCNGLCMTAFSSIPTGPNLPTQDAPPIKMVQQRPIYERVDQKDDMFPDGRVHDFGKVAQGTICKHAFRIVNTSDVPLRIIGVRTS
jgi:hypothetical protein